MQLLKYDPTCSVASKRYCTNSTLFSAHQTVHTKQYTRDSAPNSMPNSSSNSELDTRQYIKQHTRHYTKPVKNTRKDRKLFTSEQCSKSPNRCSVDTEDQISTNISRVGKEGSVAGSMAHTNSELESIQIPIDFELKCLCLLDKTSNWNLIVGLILQLTADSFQC